MKKIIFISIVIIILVATVFVVFKQISNPPAGFNFIFKYGSGAKNELNTFKQTYTQDMVVGPSVKVKMNLSNMELNSIYQKLNDLKLFDEDTEPKELFDIEIKETFDENGKSQGKMMIDHRPIFCSNYYLKVRINSEQKELSWDNCRGKMSDKFQQFTSFVIQIIESKEEYKKLPKPRGGYL